MNTGTDLRSKLGEINQQIVEKHAIAQAKWSAFESARDAAAKKGGDAEIKAAERVHVEYTNAAVGVKALEQRRDEIFEEIAGGGDALIRPMKDGGFGSPSPFTAWERGAKSVGGRAAQSFAYKELVRSGALTSSQKFMAKVADIDPIELKALITGLSDTSAGAFITNQRGAYVPQPRRVASVLNLVSVGQTNVDAIEYARQTTFTNVAAETAEATTTDTGTKPEATIAFEKVTETVKTIAHWVPSTRRALADEGQLQALIDNQLRYGLELRLENQIVNGDGAGENLRGILNTSGILTQARGSDTNVDAIAKAITQLQTGYVQPTGVAINPANFETIRLAKETTGAYIFGDPSTGGVGGVWGLDVVVSTAVPSGTALVGDWRQAQVWLREAAQVLVSDSHESFFIKNQIAILAEMRAAFGVLLPAAFAKVTSLT